MTSPRGIPGRLAGEDKILLHPIELDCCKAKKKKVYVSCKNADTLVLGYINLMGVQLQLQQPGPTRATLISCYAHRPNGKTKSSLSSYHISAVLN